MKLIIFLTILFCSFNSYSALNLELFKYESKNIEFGKDIDTCSGIYNIIEYICGSSNIIINMKETNNADRILILFKDGTREMITIKRKRGTIRLEVNNIRNKNILRPDHFGIRYNFSLSERYGETKFFQRRHRLSLNNTIGNIYWNVNLFAVENSFTERRNSAQRVFFNTTLKYKKIKFYFGENSSMPNMGVSLMSSRVYGGDILYKDKNFFINIRSGKRGTQYNYEKELINSISIGDIFFNNFNLGLSYAENPSDSIDIFGFRLKNSFFNNKVNTDFTITESNGFEYKKYSYDGGINFSGIYENKIFAWQNNTLKYQDSPDGVINITGGNTSVSQSFKSMSNRFRLFIPENIGTIHYNNYFSTREFGLFNSYSNAHDISYRYKEFGYGISYSEFYNNLNTFVSKRISNNISYIKKGKSYDNIFGLNYSTYSSENSTAYSTGISHSLKGNSIRWNNRLLMSQQETEQILSEFRDNMNKTYSISSGMSFIDLIGLDEVGFSFQSRFQEDQLDNLYNSTNSFGLNLRKKIKENHSMSIGLRHNTNNTYDGKKEYHNLNFNYTFNFKTKHNVINNIINNKDIIIELYEDVDFDSEIGSKDLALSGDLVEIYESSGALFGEYIVKNGKIKISGIDKNKSYFANIKNRSDLELIKSSFSYSNNQKLIAQSYYTQIVDVKDIQNNENVTTAELTVRCRNKKYTRKFTGGPTSRYELKYPRNASCFLQVNSITNETYYDIEYEENLPDLDNGVVYIKLKRYSRLFGQVVNGENDPLVGKEIKFMGKKTKTDEFGYYEFLFNKGEIGKLDFRNDVLNKNKSLNSCRVRDNFFSFSNNFLLEKRIDIFCNN